MNRATVVTTETDRDKQTKLQNANNLVTATKKFCQKRLPEISVVGNHVKRMYF